MYYGMFDNSLRPIVKMDIGQIMKARKLNQRNKAQKRGFPTAGINFCGRFALFCTGTYINPNKPTKKRLKSDFPESTWKHIRKMSKKNKIRTRKQAA